MAGAVLFPALSVLAGCGGDTATDPVASSAAATGSGAAEESATPTSAAAGTSAADSGSPFPADVRPDTAEPVDPAGLTVTELRAGAHDGFDRVVFELAGQGTPGWDVEYVDSATAEGTGAPIDLAGPVYLRVVLQGTSYPYESGSTEVTRGPVAVDGTSTVTGAFYDGTFEGQSLAYVGVRAQAPFRVYALDGPTRIVVEVATS
ncbi:MAG: uncharacterized protein JWQ26_1742 [Modestobacter sp.]|jgi:hypothetical protein|nr:uncharacterized protein [Modestobacter sp.]